jgi:hypothetical protein
MPVDWIKELFLCPLILVEGISGLVEQRDRTCFVMVASIRQHAEDDRNFVAAAITHTGGVIGDNRMEVTGGATRK